MNKLDLINSALLKCGLPLAASLADCDWNAALVFEQSAETTLRTFGWGFAMKYASLAMDETPPAFGYQYSYALPSDCARIIDVHNCHDLRAPSCEFKPQANRRIVTNANPCNIRYVWRDYDPEDWPPDFADAVAALIAAKIAGLSAQKMALVPQLMQLYNVALAMAQAADAKENMERMPREDFLQNARLEK